tara:strand:+ start:390 stop:1124 length:735 start_codon:yes stop_codon:yes gene_type:complete
MRPIFAAALALSVTACASVPGDTTRNDPYEDFNRAMFEFNIGVDEAVFEPTAKGYEAVTPQWGRDRVSDFFTNLNEPITFINDVLQGNGERALQTGFRFTINSTVGLAGLFDVAGYEGLPAHDEDFGQTLAVWGVDSGPYLVMPLLGSTNPRDLVGFGVDRAANPTNMINYTDDSDDEVPVRIGMALLNGINARVAVKNQIETLRSQPEPYVALRRTYTSRRNSEIRNGQTDPNAYEDLPDFDD